MIPFDSYYQEILSSINTYILNKIGSTENLEAPLFDAMVTETLAEKSGRRIGSFIVLETARLLGGNQAEDRFYQAAAAVELAHDYSQTLDELSDIYKQDILTSSPEFSEAGLRFLAGNASLALAFELIAPYPQLVHMLAVACGAKGMIAAEVLNKIYLQEGFSNPMDAGRMQSLKTMEMFYFSATAAAHLLGAGDIETAALREYADTVGLIYQLTEGFWTQEGRQDENRQLAERLRERAHHALRVFKEEETVYLRALIDFILARNG